MIYHLKTNNIPHALPASLPLHPSSSVGCRGLPTTLAAFHDDEIETIAKLLLDMQCAEPRTRICIVEGTRDHAYGPLSHQLSTNRQAIVPGIF